MNIGIIGGSGLYEMDGLENIEMKFVDTPYGDPSDAYVCGTFKDVNVFFLPRHGRGHRLMPSEINYRANIYGFKSLGVERILSVTAVGSLKEEHRPRDVVLPDQYFDRTKNSQAQTFFGEGIVGHVSFGDPSCEVLRNAVADAARKVIESKAGELDTRLAVGGTYVNMEGPAFSTKAESNVYRNFGFDVIGMTSLAEAKLCREAEICYQNISMITDYDCWHESEEVVTAEIVIGHLMANTAMAKEILMELIPNIPEDRDCPCESAMGGAVVTSPDAMSEETRKKMGLILSRYFF